MNATATGTLAEEHFDPTWVAASSSPVVREVPLTAAVRRRAVLLGTFLTLIALVAAAVLALLIVAGPFHTSLGSLG